MALIEREALAQNAQPYLVEYGEYIGEDVREIKMVSLNQIEPAPVVDAVPVVHGRWEEHRYGTTLDPSCVEYSCSVCGKFVDDYMPNYCPNCGARMDAEGGNS